MRCSAGDPLLRLFSSSASCSIVTVLAQVAGDLGDAAGTRLSPARCCAVTADPAQPRIPRSISASAPPPIPGLFAWLSAAPFILQNFYGLTPLGFRLRLHLGSFGYLIGTLIATPHRAAPWHRAHRSDLGACAMIVGGAAMCCARRLDAGFRHDDLMLPMALYLAGLGLVFPQSIAGGLIAVPGARRGGLVDPRLCPAILRRDPGRRGGRLHRARTHGRSPSR